MRLIGKNRLEKLKHKNRGNAKLGKAIDNIVKDIEESSWANEEELKEARPDSNCVHNDGFYFFDLNVHRTLIFNRI